MTPITCDSDLQAISADPADRFIRKENSAYFERDKRKLPKLEFMPSTLAADILSIDWASREGTHMNADYSAQSNRIDFLAARAVEEVNYYRTLPGGWDGYNAKHFSALVIRRGQQVINFVRKYFIDAGVAPREITPGPISDGSLDIEVSYEGKRLIVTLPPDEGNVTIYSQDEGESTESAIAIKKLDLGKQLSWLLS